MRIQGKLIEVRHNSGQFTPQGESESRAWENAEVRIFDGREVVVVKAKRDAIAQAMNLRGMEGTEVAIDVDSPREVITQHLELTQA